MPSAQWKGTSNPATRYRIRQIRWKKREIIGAVLMALLAGTVAILSAFLESTIKD